MFDGFDGGDLSPRVPEQPGKRCQGSGVLAMQHFCCGCLLDSELDVLCLLALMAETSVFKSLGSQAEGAKAQECWPCGTPAIL